MLLEIVAGSTSLTGEDGAATLIGAGALNALGTLALAALGTPGVLGALGALAAPEALPELSPSFARLDTPRGDGRSLPTRRLFAARAPDADAPLDELPAALPFPDERSPGDCVS